jgi:ABC-2 type transport system permease protein
MAAKNLELNPAKEWRKMRGFKNLFWKENRGWWGTRRWWVNTMLWLGMLGGLIFLMAFVVPSILVRVGDPTVAEAGGPAAFGLEMGKSVFFELGTTALAFGAIVLSLDLVLQEKQTGIMEWLLAKPVARRSYLLAKLAASTLAILVLLIAIPASAAYLLLSLRAGKALTLTPFLIGVGIMTAHTLFYLCLTLALGTVFNSRPPILGITLVSLMGGSMIAGLVKPMAYITPWTLAKMASLVNIGQSIPTELVTAPVIASLIWCVIFILFAIRKLENTEF